MAQIIKPRAKELKQDGEIILLAFLEKELDEAWTVYAQPFLNGDEPDFVALNPKAGIIVFEVKDYIEGAYVAEGRKWMVKDGGKTHYISSPVDQIGRYKNNIISLYCPEIGEMVDEDKNTFATIRLVLYFHKMSGSTARELSKGSNPNLHSNLIIIGEDELHSGELRKQCREVRTGESRIMRPQWAESLAAWLNPPRHLDERGKLELTSDQKLYGVPVDGKRKLRGVAGSGKSFVLCHRASERAARGHRVLVLTYNITLTNYLRDLIKRASPYSHDLVIITHFHGFCNLVLHKLDCPDPKEFGSQTHDDQEYFDTVLPGSVAKAISEMKVPEELQFDGIYIDESQDFKRNWLELCNCFLRSEKSEFLLVSDYAQNLYKRDVNSIEDLQGLGFPLKWGSLKQSHRLPRRICEAAWNFAQANQLNTEQLLPPARQLEMFNPDLVWHNEHDRDKACRLVLSLYNFLHVQRQVHPQDIAILLPAHEIGEEMVEYLKKHGEQPNHVFKSSEESQRKNKKTFWMGSRGVKICTVHSFKGWESRFVIALLGNKNSEKIAAEQFYVALTRCKDGVFFVNTTKTIQPGSTNWDILPELNKVPQHLDFNLKPKTSELLF